MKNSFVLYTDYLAQIELLTMEQRGVLLTAIMKYQAGEELPDVDPVTEMAFSFIKANLDKDNERYERTIEARSEAGKIGGRPRKDDTEKQTKAKKANAFSEKQTKAKKADNDNDNENDNDKDIKNILSGRPDGMDKSAVDYRAVIDYLNQKTGKHFLDKSKDTRRLIRARYEEGYTLDDFKKVIDNTSAKWRDDPRMCDYLRPVTLFGTKFESYLNMIAARSGMETHGFDYDALERQLLGGTR